MHRYGFVDPVFFALDDTGQARSNNDLDQFCVKCHSPIASMLEETPPGFQRDNLSEVAKSGVSCDVCHAVKTAVRGKGITSLRTDYARVGPIENPEPNTFHNSEYDPDFGKSEQCSPCHDVIAPNGVLVERTSQEWDVSPYSAMGVECQDCHMPTYQGKAAMQGPEREIHRHYFVGVDIPLVDFPDRQETIGMVDDLLKNAVTMDVNIQEQSISDNRLPVEVSINNDKTGHDIPTGTTFERQMWIELIARDVQADTVVFATGLLDANGDLRDSHSKPVQQNEVPKDTALKLYRGVPYTDGDETLFFWEADSVEFRTIAPFETDVTEYYIPVNPNISDMEISVRLRFRSFPPYLLRKIGQSSLIDNLVIHDMSEYTQTVSMP